MTKTKASVPMSDCSGCNAPFLLVSRSVYRELMDAEMRERGRSEGGISTGSEMRKVLMKYIPHETDILPNPVRVAVARRIQGLTAKVNHWKQRANELEAALGSEKAARIEAEATLNKTVKHEFTGLATAWPLSCIEIVDAK